jgi:hypothetical protein
VWTVLRRNPPVSRRRPRIVNPRFEPRSFSIFLPQEINKMANIFYAVKTITIISSLHTVYDAKKVLLFFNNSKSNKNQYKNNIIYVHSYLFINKFLIYNLSSSTVNYISN